MGEAEWESASEVWQMVQLLIGRTTIRKMQLYACACLYRVKWYDPEVIRLIEGYADRKVKRREAIAAVKAAKPNCRIDASCSYLFWRNSYFGTACCIGDASIWNAITSHGRPENMQERTAEEKIRRDLLRCIFGNPFRPIEIDSGWLTLGVKALAQSIYDDKRFADLPILADALDEAGCQSPAILAHCRQSAEHVRGCWVVDLILGQH